MVGVQGLVLGSLVGCGSKTQVGVQGAAHPEAPGFYVSRVSKKLLSEEIDLPG